MSNWSLNDEYKIRLNLSPLALNILQQDQLTFCAKSRTQFLNRVFLNAHTRSKASIARQLEHSQERYQALFAPLRLSDSALHQVIARLLSEEEQQLTQQHTGYESAHKAVSHTLSEDAVDAILDAKAESKYYTVAQYFKAVIEDYCRQSISERETVYFADLFSTIRDAIDNHQQLELCNRNRVRYQVHPYRIIADPQSTYHYLVCYARSKNQQISKKAPYCFRINQLSSVRNSGTAAFLSEKDKKDLDAAVRTQGVQFLVGQCKTVKVQLTQKGVQKLKRYATLRPLQVGDPEGDIYTFYCTELQAEYYFLKLGDDAKILEPAKLRRRFAQFYATGAALYAADASENRNG